MKRVRVNFSQTSKGVVSAETTLEVQGEDLNWHEVLDEATELMAEAIAKATDMSKAE